MSFQAPLLSSSSVNAAPPPPERPIEKQGRLGKYTFKVMPAVEKEASSSSIVYLFCLIPLAIFLGLGIPIIQSGYVGGGAFIIFLGGAASAMFIAMAVKSAAEEKEAQRKQNEQIRKAQEQGIALVEVTQTEGKEVLPTFHVLMREQELDTTLTGHINRYEMLIERQQRHS